MDDQGTNRKDEARTGCSAELVELIATIAFAAFGLLLPYSLLVIPPAAVALWYFWRPRQLRFSVAAMLWITAAIAIYLGFAVVLLRR